MCSSLPDELLVGERVPVRIADEDTSTEAVVDPAIVRIQVTVVFAVRNYRFSQPKTARAKSES